MTVAILMPVYNEGLRARQTLSSIRARAEEFGGVMVFLVDDGSRAPVALNDLPGPTPHFGLVLARHATNLGQGAALETSRQLALADGRYATYLTMDSDGQHSVDGALAITRAINEGADVAFGDRFRGRSNVPLARRVLLRAARCFEWAITGVQRADVHNGLRGFSARAVAEIGLRQNRMAHATEIAWRVSRRSGWRVVEVPVAITYPHECQEKGQRTLGALAIVQDLLTQYLFGDSR